MLEINTKAPSFNLPDEEGNMHTLEEYRGHRVILYFYPRDNTPGGSLTVVSNFSLTKSLKTLIISMLLSFFIVKFAKINVLIWANVCYNRHRR